LAVDIFQRKKSGTLTFLGSWGGLTHLYGLMSRHLG
jgi:hypothetical protein